MNSVFTWGSRGAGREILPVGKSVPGHGKAFDNRAGLSVMIEAFKKLCREGHPNTLIAAATVQEEVGTRGARTAGVAMQPDCVIVLEGPPANGTPGLP